MFHDNKAMKARGARVQRLRKNSILGGAALQRCDNRPIINTRFSAQGHTDDFFAQPLHF